MKMIPVMALPLVCGCAPLAEEDGEAISGRAMVSSEVVMLEELGPPVLTALDLETEQTSTAFQVASMGFAYELDTSGPEVVLSYTRPPVEGEAAFDRSAIVILEGEEVERIACDDAPDVWCSYPARAGDFVWFSEYGAHIQGDVELKRVNLSTREVDRAIPWATEAAISPDGREMAWIAVDPNDGSRRLEIGGIDGARARTLVPAGAHEDIGLPVFSADGRAVYYVSINPAWDYLSELMEFVVPSAYAHESHELPGDWWEVDAVTGETRRITELGVINYDGRADPGGVWLMIATREGVRQVDIETGESELIHTSRTIRALGLR